MMKAEADEFMRLKRKHIFFLSIFLFFLWSTIYDSLSLNPWMKISLVVASCFVIIGDHLTDYKMMRDFCRIFDEYEEMSKRHTETLAHMRRMTEGLDGDMVSDSIHLTNRLLAEAAHHEKSSGAFKTFDVDREFDAVLLLKRKSLPLDEMIQVLHEGRAL